MLRTARSLLAAAALLAVAHVACADEGMWLLNKPPLAALKAHNFEPSPAWLEAMQKSAVRFSTGGSGSIVSSGGLVMTNHHVASDVLAKLSTKERNLLDEGFLARTPEQELACPDLELNVLWEITDVTAQVNAAVTPGMAAAQAGIARRQAIATIEKEGEADGSLKAEVVTLYQGGQYHLYRYKRYTDVRLVFAPEKQIAFFGGDADNFEYPRYNLDVTFFRIYENGKPLAPAHHLRWSDAGAAENELIFVFGHPGRTRRGLTLDHLKFIRDVEMPWRLASLWRAEVKAQTFAGRSRENARIIAEDLFGIANGRKASTGAYAGLLDPALFERKAEEEKRLRSKIEADPKLAAEHAGAWAAIKRAQDTHRSMFVRQSLERAWRGSELASRARHIVRLPSQLAKPSRERLREYGDAQLDSLYLELYSPAPIYDAREVAMIESALSMYAERLGADDPLVVTLLDGLSPRARAEQLVAGCTFKDPEARKALVKAGIGAAALDKDPLLKLMHVIDGYAGELRKRYEDEVEAVERAGYASIAAARFAIEGDSVYPDATFTLRMSFGTVQGIPGTTPVPPFTTIAGTFERAKDRAGHPDFVLPPSWEKKKDALKGETPFNFICTADIIGGNSGSPVVNAKGEVVGLIFDGNLDSLVGDFVYDSARNRAVAVDSRGIVESLRAVYEAKELLAELAKP